MKTAETLHALEASVDLVRKYFEGLSYRNVNATIDREEMLKRLAGPIPEYGADASDVINELVAAVDEGLLNSASGRFFAWVIGGVNPAALAADVLTAAWDQNAAIYASSPASSVVEEVAGSWLKELLRLPENASFAFTTGCQMAHVTCLAAARNHVLKQRGWDVETQGLCGAPAVRILTSTECHGSIIRAARILGLGSQSITRLPAGENGTLSASTLQAALEESDAATIVSLQAADLNIGAYDNYEELIPVAHAHNAWVHIDGAFGLWINTSDRFQHLVKGIDKADSWSTDGHKWLNVPYDCGIAFTQHPEAHRNAMTHKASYLTHGDEERDALDWTPEWSRRARAFPLWAALKHMGKRGVADMIERCCDFATKIVDELGGMPGCTVLARPIVNQGLVRFSPPENHRIQNEDDYTDFIVEAINATGEVFFSGTTWRGQRCMRVSVVNWQTTEIDIQRTIDAISRVLQHQHTQRHR